MRKAWPVIHRDKNNILLIQQVIGQVDVSRPEQEGSSVNVKHCWNWRRAFSSRSVIVVLLIPLWSSSCFIFCCCRSHFLFKQSNIDDTMTSNQFKIQDHNSSRKCQKHPCSLFNKSVALLLQFALVQQGRRNIALGEFVIGMKHDFVRRFVLSVRGESCKSNHHDHHSLHNLIM